jgi:hypothetical protein
MRALPGAMLGHNAGPAVRADGGDHGRI